MKTLHNIEKSPRRGHYLGKGYNGSWFEIQKEGRDWMASPMREGCPHLVAPTLAILSVMLENVIS